MIICSYGLVFGVGGYVDTDLTIALRMAGLWH